MEENKPITVKDLKGRMVHHLDLAESYISTYRDEDHGVTVSHNTHRKTMETTSIWTIDGDNTVYDNSIQIVEAYNKKHFPVNK